MQKSAPLLCSYMHGNGKDHPITGQQRSRGGSRGLALFFHNLGAMRGWVVSTKPRPLYPREIPGTPCTGVWVGPRAGLDVCEKISPPPGFDPRTVQPVAQSLYPAHHICTVRTLNYLYINRVQCSYRTLSDVLEKTNNMHF
jgi:hypothetical protein